MMLLSLVSCWLTRGEGGSNLLKQHPGPKSRGPAWAVLRGLADALRGDLPDGLPVLRRVLLQLRPREVDPQHPPCTAEGRGVLQSGPG